MRAAHGLLALVLLAGCTLFSTPEGVGTISADDLAARIASGDAPVVLDVRSEAEFRESHVPGALNIPHDELAERLDEIGAAPDDEIVVHCKSGVRAGFAERTLQDAGYTNLLDLEGHMQGWVAAGHPTE